MQNSLPFDPSRISRVLIYRLGSLGDTMVAVPALRLVQQTFPHAERVMLTNVPVHAKAPAASAILEGSGLVHRYIRYPAATRSPLDLVRVGWNIRRFHPDLLVYLAAPRGEAIIARDLRFFRLCGIRQFVSLPVGDLGSSLLDAQTGLWESEAARLTRSLSELGPMDINDPASWDLGLSDRELRKAAEALGPAQGRPLVACGPGTKMQAKDWGRENWRALLNRLSDCLPDAALVMVGAADDAEVSEYAAADWRGPVVNLCGRLSPRETAAVLRQAEVFMGPDSGPMHLAAAYGVPCAIAFAARDLPGRWYPAGRGNRIVYHRVACAGCRLETCVERKKICLTSIAVDEMLDAVLAARSHGQQLSSRTLA